MHNAIFQTGLQNSKPEYSSFSSEKRDRNLFSSSGNSDHRVKHGLQESGDQIVSNLASKQHDYPYFNIVPQHDE